MKHFFKYLKAPLERLCFPKVNASLLLLLATVGALAIANSPLMSYYQEILSFPVSIRIGELQLFSHHGEAMMLSEFVNDALMTVFFFVVGLEIKQEILVGELSSLKKALLPIFAALGGMVIPVAMYFLVCHEAPGSMGAAIPMATDIAFALAVLGVLGKRVPYSLKIFLTALAVVDDIGGIIVIAIFYSGHIAWIYLALSALLLLIMFVAGRIGVHSTGFYYAMGFLVWLLFAQSGIHPTIAGVLAALCTPAQTKVHLERLRERLRLLFDAMPKDQHREAKGAMVLSHHQLDIMNSIRKTSRHAISPVQIMESELSPLVNYLILPLFAFVNTGIALGDITSDGLFGVPLAITLGLFPGKAIGIFLFTLLAVRLGICALPEGMNSKNLFSISILGGVGFTVSLFVANLSFGANGHMELLTQAKLGIFVGTLLSALIGLWSLSKVLPQAKSTAKAH